MHHMNITYNGSLYGFYNSIKLYSMIFI